MFVTEKDFMLTLYIYQYTSTFPITNGVRQGYALSSILFGLVL